MPILESGHWWSLAREQSDPNPARADASGNHFILRATFLNHGAEALLLAPVSSVQICVTRMFYRCHGLVSCWQNPTAAWSTLPFPQKAFLWLWRSPSAYFFQVTHLPSHLPSPMAHLLKCPHSRWLLSITAAHRRQLWWKAKTDSTRSHCSVSNGHAALFLNNSTNNTHIACSQTP